MIRIGLRKKIDRQHEVAYRLIMREVPSPQQDASPLSTANGVRVLLQLRVPVYFNPETISASANWKVSRTADGQLAIEVENTGNVHMVVSNLVVRDADPTPLVEEKMSVAVFPGQSFTWKRKLLRQAKGNKLTLAVVTDGNQRTVEVNLSP